MNHKRLECIESKLVEYKKEKHNIKQAKFYWSNFRSRKSCKS